MDIIGRVAFSPRPRLTPSAPQLEAVSLSSPSPKMALFGLGTVAYFALLMINAVAVLSKDRFLAPLGLTTSSFQNQQQQQGGGAYGGAGFDAYGMPVQQQYGGGEVSVKQRAVQLVDAVRTLMRSAFSFILFPPSNDKTDFSSHSPPHSDQHRRHHLRAPLRLKVDTPHCLAFLLPRLSFRHTLPSRCSYTSASLYTPSIGAFFYRPAPTPSALLASPTSPPPTGVLIPSAALVVLSSLSERKSFDLRRIGAGG